MIYLALIFLGIGETWSPFWKELLKVPGLHGISDHPILSSVLEKNEGPWFIDYKMEEKWNFNLEFIQDKDCSKLGRSRIYPNTVASYSCCMTQIRNLKDILQSGTLRYLKAYKNQSVCCKSISDSSSCPVSCVGIFDPIWYYCTLYWASSARIRIFNVIDKYSNNPYHVTISHSRIVCPTFFLDSDAIFLMSTLLNYCKIFPTPIWRMDFLTISTLENVAYQLSRLVTSQVQWDIRFGFRHHF